jgi:hypothetical protein
MCTIAEMTHCNTINKIIMFYIKLGIHSDQMFTMNVLCLYMFENVKDFQQESLNIQCMCTYICCSKHAMA